MDTFKPHKFRAGSPPAYSRLVVSIQHMICATCGRDFSDVIRHMGATH